MAPIAKLAAALLTAGVTFTAVAADDPLSVEVKEKNSVAFVSGGVGVEQQREIEEKGRDFSLKMTFATPDGHYLGGGKVKIQRGDETVLDVASQGPIFFADLEPGDYRVTAEPLEYEAQRAERDVTVADDNQATLHFTWQISQTN